MSQVQQVGFVGKLTDLRIYAGMDTLRESVVRKKTGIRLFLCNFYVSLHADCRMMIKLTLQEQMGFE